MRRAPRALLFVLAAGLLVRIVLAAGHSSLASDERDYDALGWGLASTGAYEDAGTPTAYRSIGYPAFIAGIYALAGRSPRTVLAVQAVLDLTTALLLYLLLARRSRRAAVLATAIWAFYPAAVLFSGALLSETLFTTLLVALTLLLDRAPPRAPSHVIPGLILGALVLIKPEALLFAAVLAALLLARGLRPAAIVALLGAAALVVTPWLIRNTIVFGSPLLTTSAGVNLLIGNNPAATGAYGPAEVPVRVREASGEAAVDGEARRAAVAFIASRPDRFVALSFVKAAYVLSSDAELAVGRFGAARSSPSGTLPSFHERYRALPAAIHLAVNLPYFALVLAGILGLVVRRGETEHSVFAAIVVSVLLVHVVAFGGSRFHAPWMPFFSASAAGLSGGTWKGLREARPQTVAAAFIVAAAFVAVWIVEWVRLAL